jgi:type VI secretion system protein ImpH
MNWDYRNLDHILLDFLKAPEEFNFFEAVRQIQRYSRLSLQAEKEHREGGEAGSSTIAGLPLGENTGKSTEIVKFRSHVSNSFPASSIQNAHSVFRKDRHGHSVRQIEIMVNFIGLFGPNGILPRHYTDQLIQMERMASMPEPLAMRDFLDMFNNRLTALFYLSWEKYQLPVHHEIEILQGRDPLIQLIRCLGGLGTSGMRRRLSVSVGSGEKKQQKYVSDLMLSLRLSRSRPLMSVGAIQNMVRRVTGDRTRVRCFDGTWVPLKREEQTCLSHYGTSRGPILGRNTGLGSRVWSIHSEYVAEIGPVSWERLNAYLPEVSNQERILGKKTLLGLVGEILKLRSDPTLRPRIRILTDIATIQPIRLGSSESGSDQSSKLGWNTWLGDPSSNVKFDDNATCKYRRETEFSLPQVVHEAGMK